jgi:hypothetical protein
MPGCGNRDLHKLIKTVLNQSDDPDSLPTQLAHKLVVGGYEDRCIRGLTGDWIIYAKLDGINYYLEISQLMKKAPRKMRQISIKSYSKVARPIFHFSL